MTLEKKTHAKTKRKEKNKKPTSSSSSQTHYCSLELLVPKKQKEKKTKRLQNKKRMQYKNFNKYPRLFCSFPSLVSQVPDSIAIDVRVVSSPLSFCSLLCSLYYLVFFPNFGCLLKKNYFKKKSYFIRNNEF